MVSKLVIIGPAWPLRGGLSAFDEKLAATFTTEGIATSIETFSLQYPSFLFPGKTQYTNQPAPKNINIHAGINSINPLNWIKIGLQLKNIKPDLIIVRFWLPFFGPSLGTILRIVKLNNHTKVIALVDNMIPHEHRMGDKIFTQYFAKSIDGFLTMSDKVSKDVKLFSHKPILLSPHPIFEHFGENISKENARNLLGLVPSDKIILFFGFIRKYKGLDLLLKAMATPTIKQQGIKLMVVGEFYEDASSYLELIKELGIEDQVLLYNEFVPDEEVKKYVCSADFIIQPYRSATQSGVTPLAYHFEKPMLVTKVGGLADTVPDGKVGVVVAPDEQAIAAGITLLYQTGAAHYIPYLIEEKKKYSWLGMVRNFLILHQQI
jgi:glycosyltransferase involved in cell wall biosynthesis